MRLLEFSTVKQGKKNWNFTNSTQIPLTIFHRLDGKFKIWNLEKGLKMLLKWQIEETFFLYFVETRSERGIGPATKTRDSVFVWIWADSVSPPRNIIQNLFSFIYISILPRN